MGMTKGNPILSDTFKTRQEEFNESLTKNLNTRDYLLFSSENDILQEDIKQIEYMYTIGFYKKRFPELYFENVIPTEMNFRLIQALINVLEVYGNSVNLIKKLSEISELKIEVISSNEFLYGPGMSFRYFLERQKIKDISVIKISNFK